MIVIIAKWTVILFGLFLIFAGFLMLFAPKRARQTLRKAGSTNLINYLEISVRMIPAAALVIISEYSKFPLFFQVLGWFMLVTSITLFLVPRKMHQAYSMKSADILKPLYFQFISPLSLLFGATLIYMVL